MRAIVAMVANVIRKKSFQVSLVHSDDVIEQITATAFQPPFGCTRLENFFLFTCKHLDNFSLFEGFFESLSC
jgi:hypothetical protein